MASVARGTGISPVEVSNISQHGFWLLSRFVDGRPGRAGVRAPPGRNLSFMLVTPMFSRTARPLLWDR